MEDRAMRHAKAGMNDLQHYMTSCSELKAELAAKDKLLEKMRLNLQGWLEEAICLTTDAQAPVVGVSENCPCKICGLAHEAQALLTEMQGAMKEKGSQTLYLPGRRIILETQIESPKQEADELRETLEKLLSLVGIYPAQ